MTTLIIYDNDGFVIQQVIGSYRVPKGIPFLEVDIPQGKRIKLVDGIGVDTSTTPHRVILEDIPLTETQLLQKQVEEQKQAIAELTLMLATTN